MTAYLFVAIAVHDLAWADAYQANVPSIMTKHGGEFVAASANVKRHEGDGPAPDRAALMKFPSMKAIDDFVSDPEYRPYRTARLAASTSDAFALSAEGS